MEKRTLYILLSPDNYKLVYDPSQGLIFFRDVADCCELSRRLGISISSRRYGQQSHKFSIEEMRGHYRDRLNEGYLRLQSEYYFESTIPKADSVKMPEDFEHGFTDI